jgi:hypothetical protein
MQNTVLKNALNGIGLAAAALGDMDTIAKLQQMASMAASIVPQGRFVAVAATAYDGTAASTTAFLDFGGLPIGTGGIPNVTTDSQADSISILWPTTQPSPPAVWLLGG